MQAIPDKVICVQGPTASGKSELAERLACHFDGEIISADSMQIYRGMNIGTAKVTREDRCVAYHCLDIVDPGTPYSAALFQRDARAAFEDIESRGKSRILCGGTGLYVRAALDDMEFASGDTGNPIREKYTSLAREIGSAALHERLASVDPQSAAVIHPNNVRRVVRAFEMLEEGESYAQRKEAFKQVPPYVPSVRIALDVRRDLLYERIDARVDRMIEEGLVEEVEDLLRRGFRAGITAPQAIGYKEIVDALDGKTTLDEAIACIKQSTRRYAKRQLSWLRGEREIIWLHADDGITDRLTSEAVSVIEGECGT